tara:strand:- start:2220 stop:2507 length:288 start_codon:yes stop_codon:yes gene_type:complete
MGMQAKSDEIKLGLLKSSRHHAIKRWNSLNEGQKTLLTKTWKIISYKWQWQIALNTPLMALWLLDKTIPSVHEFDMKIIASLHLPNLITSFMGLS